MKSRGRGPMLRIKKCYSTMTMHRRILLVSLVALGLIVGSCPGRGREVLAVERLLCARGAAPWSAGGEGLRCAGHVCVGGPLRSVAPTRGWGHGGLPRCPVAGGGFARPSHADCGFLHSTHQAS